MQTAPNEPTYSLSEADQLELDKLVSVLELSDSTTTIFAIAPESGPQHPVVEELKSRLLESEEQFQFRNFFYSDDSLHNFFYGLDDEVRSPQPPTPHNPPLVRGERGAMESRLVVMVFGIEQLPRPRRVDELRRLNLGRDSLFKRDLVLIFWLNRVEFLDEFRHRAPDFWDWRGKVVQFEARPRFNPFLYPYLEWLIAENSYLKISGVMQVQRQVDIFLDQIYVSLQGVRRQQVTDTSERGHRELEMMTSRHIGKGRRGSSALDELELLDEVEPLVPDFVPTEVSTKTVTQKVDLSQAVRENQYCVILGAPGAGKTTLLRYLALHFGMAKRDGMERVAGGEGLEELGKPLLPVFFRIADYAERLAQEPDLSLLEYLRQFYRQWEVYFKASSSPHSQGYVSPPSPPILGGTGVQNSSNLGETGIQSPLDLGETGIQSPPELGDLGGEIEGNTHPELPPQPPLLRGELELEGGGNSDIPQLLCEQMRLGQCLMLLDGLDEVFSQESRRRIVERINQFVEEFAANKFVVTSRIAGYRDVKLSERFAEFTIEDMGSEQVEGFLHRWCRAVEQAQQPEASEEQWQRVGDEQTREILGAIQANEGVKRLTANPLLLTILALIHRNGSRLPHRRVELYALAVKTLTEDWQLGKKLPDAPQVMLKESEVVELLAPLAYWMHEEKPSGVVTQAEAEERLAATLAELNDDEPDSESVRQAVEQFLRKVRETTGLFVERAPGVYGFMHLTFEEYFAARYIADHERSEILELIGKHLHEPRWDEPILLALGYYGVHSPRQVNKLVEELFRNLEGYEPAIEGGEIRIKNASSPDAVLIWSVLQDESADNSLELRLKELLFAGEVLTQVEVNSRIRLKLIEKLVLTYLSLDADFDDDATKQLLRLLRQIDLFNQKGEVRVRLQQAVNNSRLSEEQRIKAQTAILYVACGEPGAGLVNCVTEIVKQLEPTLFCSIKDLVVRLGEEMTPALETTRQNQISEEKSHRALTFLTAMSYIRTDNYGKAIDILEEINHCSDSSISAYIDWSLATCYQEKKEFDRATDYYQECFEKLARYIEPTAFLLFWRNRGICYRLHAKHEQALDCFQNMLTITREIHQSKEEANCLWHIGKTYKEWSKYEEAIAHHQQSLELYQQLGRDKHVANQWYWLSDCYKDWGKYEQAVECQQQCLRLRQQREDQSRVALSYYQLGRLYQAWSKYEDAITHYQQSREIYEQLGKEKNVANQWGWLSDCYRDWGKYEQAIGCQQQCLTIRQTLDDQSLVAVTYYQLGRINQAWGKYEQSIVHYQQSRDLHEQLGREQNVANQWYWLGNCYQSWGKYEQAIECQQQCLRIRQTLDDQSDVALAYYQLGRIYQAWGKYEEAIAHYQQSLALYEQLGKEKNVANQWGWVSDCYRDWGKYEQALECRQQFLQLHQSLENQSNIASAYYHLGRIYQAWGKYEQAIAHYQQSRDLYEQLGKDKNVANQWSWLAYCYQKWGKYEQAIEYFQQSHDLYEHLGQNENVANQLRLLSDCYRDWGKYQQAEECELKDLEIRQQLDDQTNIADAYYQLGRIYQSWGKYEQAITHYQQSRELYEQLGKEKDVANQWCNLADCYREWGKYQQTEDYQQRGLAVRQQLEDQSWVALSYYQLGHIYQDWGKYEQAIAHHQQSLELYEQLGREQNVANRLNNLASCYRNLKDYTKAIEYYQQCRDLYQQLGQDESVAWCCRQIANTQRLLAKNTPDTAEASNLLTQAEQNIRQAIQLDTAGDYKKNLAYDYTTLGLLYSERLRLFPPDAPSLPEQIAQFEAHYNTGLTYLTELGQTIDRADETLDMARAYLEINVLENLDRAEALTQESLQIFQDYNRRQLEAAARKLLGEIYLKRAQHHQPNAEATAHQFLSESLQLYRELDLTEKAAEVEQLIPIS
jgi:tetratricopeptide (TPR) repeat protein